MAGSLEKQVLTLVGEVMGLLDLDEFSRGLLNAVRDVVPSDWVALNEVPADAPGAVALIEPTASETLYLVFARLATTNPIAAHFLRTGDGRAARISDFITRRELHRLELYRQVYEPMGVEYQIAFTLSSGVNRILGVSLSRGQRDFTARERDLLNLARPYLIQAYRNALTVRTERTYTQIPVAALCALGLTTRQSEVLRLIATGHTGPQAAVQLGISPRTAQKHLELAYRRLGVSSRSEASRAAGAALV
jgi:DNA-binding CsgD family transcriptional regulator